ncbi:40S ribosomal protein S8-2 [Striga hermonthica]|uniref:40S ribosomal protein S8 n=1 Tax=Striga hermonthica TaxID=68872 RepID=A0A9N7MR92_STRHE|nr:40S ribosomal protein S8-2 [Striga hermonthica]
MWCGVGCNVVGLGWVWFRWFLASVPEVLGLRCGSFLLFLVSGVGSGRPSLHLLAGGVGRNGWWWARDCCGPIGLGVEAAALMSVCFPLCPGSESGGLTGCCQGSLVVLRVRSSDSSLAVRILWLRYELGRQPANTKLSSNKTVRRVRVRGGNVKWRALRLDTGNFSWGSEAVTRKTRILDVVYNASNNELVRTQTLVKGAIIQVDAAPFKQWYLQHYGVDIGRKKKAAVKKDGEDNEATAAEEVKKSNSVQRKLEKRQQERKIDTHIEEQFGGGRLLAAISSRPGQCGRADGYILEGKELEFYMKKLQRKKGKSAGGA